MLNEKPVRLLMLDMITSMGLVPGQSDSRDYPNVKQGTVAAHLIRLDQRPARLQYSSRADGSDTPIPTSECGASSLRR
jgi:hypothetical protein